MKQTHVLMQAGLVVYSGHSCEFKLRRRLQHCYIGHRAIPPCIHHSTVYFFNSPSLVVVQSFQPVSLKWINYSIIMATALSTHVIMII